MFSGRVVAITTGHATREGDLVAHLQALARLGRRSQFAVLLREPSLPEDELTRLLHGFASHLQLVVHECCPGALKIVSEHCSLVCAYHRRMSAIEDSSGNPPALAIGASCHSADELATAWRVGTSYAFLSPVFSPGSKVADSRPTLGVSAFRALGGAMPVFALGGINLARHRELRAEGSYGSAVLGEVFGQSDAQCAAEALLRLLEED